ncbi:hypothetical protein [Acinetobacter rathckeae]|uniref:hypothetical protein n=1 Tax=Acinetobacter rathckeae TaxID=2605272 RepID=UPI0018A2ACB2|nr:hypothetical protein [Acinetobacter rathckeae]MBF7696167.1 hypothetical protein [Acinetobacter rathckeae]
MNEQSVHSAHIINNIDDVTNLLEKALNNEIDHFNIKIKDLEKFCMHVVGDKFHQTMTPSIMKGFIDFQSAIYRSYAQIKYSDPSILRLTKQEKSDLEIEVKVVDGSSGFSVKWEEVFKHLIENTLGKMTTKQQFISVLALILFFSGSYVMNSYLTDQKETRLAEIAANKESTKEKNAKEERLATIALLTNASDQKIAKILNEAQEKNSDVKVIATEAKHANYSLIKSAQAADTIDFNNGQLSLSGDAAQELSKSTSSKWQDVRLDGTYWVINVDSSHAAKRKIRIRNVNTQQEMLAILENDTLDQKYLNLIQDAEWAYSKIQLKIQAKTLNGLYKEASIRGASVP